MGLIGSLMLLAIGAVIGYAYFHLRKKPSDHLADQDFLDCQSSIGSNKDLAACYIDKKSRKIKAELNID